MQRCPFPCRRLLACPVSRVAYCRGLRSDGDRRHQQLPLWPAFHVNRMDRVVLMTATCAGMLIAWRSEVPGGVISLASLAAVTTLIRMGHHGVLFVLAIPGVLYKADWMFAAVGHNRKVKETTRQTLIRHAGEPRLEIGGTISLR